MTDRNDALLLALGWERRRHGSLGNLWRTKAEAEAGIPFAEARFQRPMRPYDNLEDAVDCVPEGWRVRQIEEMMDGDWIAQLSHRHKPGFVKMRGTNPAEALAEAIMKAVSHE